MLLGTLVNVPEEECSTRRISDSGTARKGPKLISFSENTRVYLTLVEVGLTEGAWICPSQVSAAS